MPSGRTARYGPDLARVHHEHFGDLARYAAATVLEELGRRHADGGLVVDLGCGTGIVARALTDAGFDVLGVDISPDMLRLATEHAPLATFVRASLLEVTRDLTLFCAAGDVDRHFRRSDERHRLRLYRPDDVTRRLRDAGFRVRRLRGYGDLRFGRGWAGFVATKS